METVHMAGRMIMRIKPYYISQAITRNEDRESKIVFPEELISGIAGLFHG